MSLSSPGHAISLFRRQPFWEGFWVRSRGFAGRDAQTQLKVQTVDLEAKSLFFIGSGRNVWHWRSPQHRSKNGVLELARPCCFPVPEAAFLGRLLGQKSWFCRSWRPNAIEGANGGSRSQIPIFYRFWTQRLTLKITPTQVKKRCPWARQAMLFPCSGGSLFGKASGSEAVVLLVMTPKRNWRCKRWISKPNPHFLEVLDATFDTEDHSNAGRKRVSLSSPGHAVSLFRRQPFWEGFWVRSRGFAGRDAQTQLKVQTVDLEAKSLFFIGSGRNVWHWRSPQHRSKNGVLELARPCYFPVPEAAFLGRLLGQKSWFCRSWRPNAIEGANGGSRSQIPIFYRFWTQRLTLKITPTQVKKRCPWARQAMLFPRSGGSLFGKAFGSEVVGLQVVTPKRNWRCKRWISKPNPYFL